MYSIFSSFLSINDFKFNIKKYEKEILNAKMKNKGTTKSNYNGWPSYACETVPKKFIALFKKINENVKEIERNLFLSKQLRLHNLWYNVNSLGSFNRPHNHPYSTVSGVYYISIPKNSGNIVFVNEPLDVYYEQVKNYNEYNSSTWVVNPKENQCVLFPSYLSHYVEPNLNKKERISISFNYGF